MMPEVFISYSSKDRDVAASIAAELTRRNIDVWWDTDLLGGENYRKKIAQVIAKARATIVIWSNASTQSEWVVGEASAARERQTLIPVKIDRSESPLDFRNLNTIDLSDWVAGDPLPDMLLKAICDKTDRLFTPANEIQQTGGALPRSFARSWYADFECLLFSLIAQGFASCVTMIPLAIYTDKLHAVMSILVAILNSTITAAIIMRPALSPKRLGVAAAWFAVAIATGVAGYFLTLAFWRVLSLNEYLVFVGFWSLGLIIMLDVARRAGSS